MLWYTRNNILHNKNSRQNEIQKAIHVMYELDQVYNKKTQYTQYKIGFKCNILYYKPDHTKRNNMP